MLILDDLGYWYRSLPKNMGVSSSDADNLMGSPYIESQKFRGSDLEVQQF